MTITRRGFLKSILAIGAAPAIVRAESLMKIWTPPQELYAPIPGVAGDYSATPTQAEFSLFQAQLEAAPFGNNYVFSVFMQEANKPVVRKSIQVEIPAGVSPTCMILPDGSLHVEGGKLLAGYEQDCSHIDGSGFSKVILTDGQVFQQKVAPLRKMPGNSNAVLHSDDFADQVWSIGGKT